MKTTLIDRFNKFIMPEPMSGCWLWTGSLNNRGYGRFNVDCKNKLASRISYEIFKGEIKDSLLVLHTCDTPSCVNPDHLYLGTYTENLMDSIKRGHRTNPVRKLTKEDVMLIKKRLCNGETLINIAKDYDVHHVVIGNIKHKKTWTNVQITN